MALKTIHGIKNLKENKMKNFLSIIITFLMVCMFSCKKSFLETTPMQSIAADRAITNIEGARAALIGLYDVMQSAAYYGRNVPIMTDLMSDNIYISARNSNRYQSFDQYNVTITDSYVSDLWENMYKVAVNANILIQKCSEMEFPAGNQAEVDHIIGEAYAIRALTYFELCRFFAKPYNSTSDGSHDGVPIVVNSDYSSVIKPARSSIADSYKQIIADLQQSITMLPVNPVGFSSSVKGRMNHYAAKAILARVYLYKGDWDNAELRAKEVILSGKYSLLSNSQFASTFRTQNNAETIFEIQYNSTDNLSSNALVNFCKQGGSYGDALATQNLYDQYTSSDVRRSTYLLMGKRSGSGGEDPAVQIVKFDNNSNYQEGVKIVRLADMYLIRAEALARKGAGQNEIDAAAALDIVRKRADASATATTATGVELQDLILLERRKEFFLEGHRLFDLTRNKKAFTKYRTAGITMPVENTSTKTILPIPRSELRYNSNVTQNPGYESQ